MPVNPFAGLAGLISPEPGMSHGAGPGALGALGSELRGRKISEGYLDLQRQQFERSRQNDAIEMLSKERDKRQAAIDAWLSAVRSGNRADVWTLGKRLQGMGIDVQMPSAFAAAGPPEEVAAAPEPDEPNFTMEERSPDEALGKKLDQVKDETVSELRGETQGQISARVAREAHEMAVKAGAPTSWAEQVSPGKWEPRIGDDMGNPFVPPFAPTRPDGTPIAPGIAHGAMQGIQPVQMGAPPLGPGGLGPSQPPPSQSWKLRDPITGTQLDIDPQDILADQEREIDQTFLPLAQMQGLDPIAQRAYQIGHEYAKGQLGFATPKEAADKGMAVAGKYMEHMQRMGLLEAKQKKGGGKGGGGAAFGSTGKSGLAVYQAISPKVQGIIDKIERSENYQKRSQAISDANAILSSFDEQTGTGDRNALGQFIKSISGAATTDNERKFYEYSAGIKGRLENMLGMLEKGKLSPELVRDLKSLVQRTTNLAAETQQRVKQDALDAAAAEVDLGLGMAGIQDPEVRNRFMGPVTERLGAPRIEAEGGTGGSSSSQRLLKKGVR